LTFFAFSAFCQMQMIHTLSSFFVLYHEPTNLTTNLFWNCSFLHKNSSP
jgi:hypothetical protein